MYVCMYVCVYVWMYVYGCMCLCMYVCMYVCMDVFVYVWMYVCVYVCVCMYVCIYGRLCVCVVCFVVVFVVGSFVVFLRQSASRSCIRTVLYVTQNSVPCFRIILNCNTNMYLPFPSQDYGMLYIYICSQVSVHISGDQGLCFPKGEDGSIHYDHVIIPANDMVVKTFTVIPVMVGELAIEVRVEDVMKFDGVRKILHVVVRHTDIVTQVISHT